MASFPPGESRFKLSIKSKRKISVAAPGGLSIFDVYYLIFAFR
jgi:hypothetical protein